MGMTLILSIVVGFALTGFLSPSQVPSVIPTNALRLQFNSKNMKPTSVPSVAKVSASQNPTKTTQAKSSVPTNVFMPTMYPTNSNVYKKQDSGFSVGPKYPSLAATTTPISTPSPRPTVGISYISPIPPQSNARRIPPTRSPSGPSRRPTAYPTNPTARPTAMPTNPTATPTEEPTYCPTAEPTKK